MIHNLWYDLRVAAQDGLTDYEWDRRVKEIESALRAELARAPNGWEQAAKLCEEKAAILRKHSQGVGGMGAAAWKIQADILDTMAEVLRARADAERREPAPTQES